MLRRQLWVANAVVAAALLGAAGAVGAAIAWWPRGGEVPRAVHVAPAATGAFVTGGAPASDPGLAVLLGEQLPAFVVATDDDRRAGGLHAGARAAQRVALQAPEAITARGAPLATAWSDMIGALDRWVSVPRSGREYDDVVATFRDHVRAVSEQLAAAGLGYYLEGDVVTSGSAAHALVYAYRVEDVAFVVAGGAPRRVLGLRRLDHLNYAHAMLGMQSEDLGDPVLLLDQIDDHVARKLAPVLAPDAPYPLGDVAWASEPEGAALQRLAGAAVRAELAAAGATDATAARALVTASVRRHEAQHGLDEERAAALPFPAPLGELIGPATDPAGRPRNFAEHCRNELSAYTSQIANDPATPKGAYFQIAHFAFDRARWGTPESYAAVLVSAGLARHLSGLATPPLIHDRALDRARLGAVARLVTAAPPEALRAAARATWQDLYGEELAVIVDRPSM